MDCKRSIIAVAVGLTLALPLMVNAQKTPSAPSEFKLTSIPAGTTAMSGNQPWHLPCPLQSPFVDGCPPHITEFLLTHAQGASAFIESATGLTQGAFRASTDKNYLGKPSMGVLSKGAPGELAAYLIEGSNALSAGTLVFYRDNAIKRDGKPEFWTEAKLQSSAAHELLSTIAHEVFHAYQAASPARIGKVGKLKWVGEGTAEAVGLAYVKAARGREYSLHYGPYDGDLRNSELAYERGHFFQSLGKVLNGEANPIGYLGALHQTPLNLGSDGIEWLDDYLRGTRVKGLRGGYGEVIAGYASDRNAYYDKNDVVVNHQKPNVKLTYSVMPFAAEAFTAMFDADLLRSNPEIAPETPGRSLLQVEIALPPEGNSKSIGLAVDRQWRDREPHVVYFAQKNQGDFEFFIRTTNVADVATETTSSKAVFTITAKPVILEGPPGCMKPGETVPLTLPAGLKLKANMGQLTSTSYTAPNSEGEALLQVTAQLTKKEAVTQTFAKVKVTKSQCGMRITLASSMLWYDAITDSSQSIDDTGEVTGFWNKRGVFVLDDERGWTLTRWSTMDALSTSATGMNYSSMVGSMPQEASLRSHPHRVAPNLIAVIDRSITALEQAQKMGVSGAAGRGIKSSGPCLHGGGICTIWQVGAPGEDGGTRVYYDSEKKIRATETFGSDETDIMRVDYGYFPVAVPTPSVVL